MKLISDEVHLWFTRPDSINQTSLLRRYKSLLTEDEIQKQQSFRFAKKRRHALITRAFVRCLLSHYAETPPDDWRFTCGFHGKPEIQNCRLPLQFNISHTDDLIICTVALNDNIGCDVELTNRNLDYLGMAEHFFSHREFTHLQEKTGVEQQRLFFDYWTLKESYIKAAGQGLTIPLADFNFRIGATSRHEYNGNIRIGFAPHRSDQSELWRHWLFYPNNLHRIAVSVKAHSDNQMRDYRFRYFENVPLVKTTELYWPGISE